MTTGTRGSLHRLPHAAALLAASVAGATVLGLLGVPAGVLIGALVGSALANRALAGRAGGSGELRPLPAPMRVVGLMMLGCLVGVRIDGHTLSALAGIALPLLTAVLLLLALDVALACVLVARYDVDALTAVFACTPGGLSGLAIMAQQRGARMGVVLAIHTVRILVVVVAVVPVVVAWLGQP